MNDGSLDVHWMPSQVDPQELAGATVVVIDVLRATTTIVHALEAGARAVIPCLEIDEAKAVAAELGQDALLAGERLGLPIDGFDLGNSPSECTPDRVAGRTLVLTTTNGTRALGRCKQASGVLVGAFVNATAVFRRIAEEPRVHILCAGTRGERGHDDELLAGMLAGWLDRHDGVRRRLSPQAEAAGDAWAGSPLGSLEPGSAGPDIPGRLAAALAETLAGRRLASIGQDCDVRTACQVDRFQTVPELDPDTFRIRSR